MATAEIIVEERRPVRRITPAARHAEILAPRSEPVSPAVAGRIRRALALLAAVGVLIQPMSLLAGPFLTNKVFEGTDAYTQWQRYAAAPAPDVLFLGPSEARTDVDTARLSNLLTRATGHRVTVGKLGFSAQAPGFLELAMYRVMARTSRPKVVVRTAETPMFNANGTCRSCKTEQITSDIWQISDLTDPGFIRLALDNDPNPGRLIAGWVAPAVAYYPAIAALDCSVVRRARTFSQALLGSVPWELAAQTPCELGAGAHPNSVMTADNQKSVYQAYLAMPVHQYAISGELVGNERAGAREALERGTKVIYLKPPFHSTIRNAAPEADSVFDAQLRSLAGELGVGIVDLSTAVPDDNRYWIDPLHLNQAGASYFAPKAAEALAGPLTALGAI